MDPVVHATFPMALRFLVDLHDKGSPYSAIKVVKTALSGLLGESQAYGMRRLGDLWITKQLMKSYRDVSAGVVAKYDYFWDPAIVHEYILENTPPRLADWDLRLTTKILAYLLKEGLAGRSSDVHRADRCSIRPSSENDKFRMIDLIRPKDTHASDAVRKMRRIYFNYTETDSRLDWRAVMNHYESNSSIQRFRLRRPQDESSCLLTFGGSNPGQKPSVDTITRWVAEILWRAGIPDEFSPHSVRGAVVTAKIRNHLEDELQGIFRSQNNLHTFYDRSGCRVFSTEEGRTLRQTRQKQVWKFRKHGMDKEGEGQDEDSDDDEE